jgi:hypothetical protein
MIYYLSAGNWAIGIIPIYLLSGKTTRVPQLKSLYQWSIQ